jgi:aryl sulfotransferase
VAKIQNTPRKTGEYQSHHFDSTRWNNFSFRNDDIVIATYSKSGTTWMQQIVGQLIFNGAEGIPVMDLCPWIDFRVLPLDEIMEAVEAMDHRRFLKTHLPLDKLVFSDKAKYIHIARDGRDTLWSLYRHHSNYTENFYEMANEMPGRVGPTIDPPLDDIVEYYHRWLDEDGFPYHPFFSHNQSWWDARDLPNVMLIHFNNLKADLPGQIRKVAEFLEIEIDESVFPKMIEHCTFEYMKDHADDLTPMLSEVFEGGGKSFINKGTNGRWRDRLSAKEIQKYDDIAARRMSTECARWIATGQMP